MMQLQHNDHIGNASSLTTRASVSASTQAAPARRNIVPHAATVPRVVSTSSMSRTRAPATRRIDDPGRN